jgi:hypothetical protein
MLRPLNKASLGYCVPYRCVPTLDRAPSAAIAASVGLRRLMDQWGVWPASPTPLTRLIGLAPLRQMHARPTHRTPPLRSAKALKRSAVGSRVSLRSIKSKGWDGSVRGKLAKGHFVQGMQHPRIFGRGHIGRGWTNIAPSAMGYTPNVASLEVLFRDGMVRSGAQYPRDALSKGCNIQEFSVGDTSVGDEITLGFNTFISIFIRIRFL